MDNNVLYARHTIKNLCLLFNSPRGPPVKDTFQTRLGSPTIAVPLELSLTWTHGARGAGLRVALPPGSPPPRTLCRLLRLSACLQRKNMSGYFNCSALWSSHRLLKQSPLINIYSLSDGTGSMGRGARVCLNNHHPSTSSPLSPLRPSAGSDVLKRNKVGERAMEICWERRERFSPIRKISACFWVCGFQAATLTGGLLRYFYN